MQRAFSALVTYIQNACRAARCCMHMYTYSYIAKSAPKSARGSLAVNDSEGYSRISSLDLYVSRMKNRSDRTVQCEQSYTGGEKRQTEDDFTSRVYERIIYEIRFLFVFLVAAIVTHAISLKKKHVKNT